MKHLGIIAAAGVAALAYVKRDSIIALFAPKPPVIDTQRAHRFRAPARRPAAPRPLPVDEGSEEEQAIQNAADMAKGTVHDMQSLGKRFGVKLPGL